MTDVQNTTGMPIWEVVGLSPGEGQVYEAMLSRNHASLADLTETTGLASRVVTRILDQLTRRGIVTRLPGAPARYSPVAPDLVASDLLAGHERQLRQFRDHVERLVATQRDAAAERHPAELIEVLEGAANVRGAFFRIQRDAAREVRVFDKPPYFNPTGGDAFETNPEEMQSLKNNRVVYRVVYERSSLEIPGRIADIWEGIRQGEQARVAGSLPLKLALGDDKVALINSTTDYHNQTAYRVHSSALLDALSELFEATWQRAVALNQSPPESDGSLDLPPVRRQLITMLASGATDETIGRTLALSVRTVQRHLHAIMDEVGADTRFQVGMEAVRRDWV